MTHLGYNLLVPMDFTEQAEFALDQALKVAKLVGGKVNLLYVHQDKKVILSKLFSSEETELFDDAVKNKLKQLANEKQEETGITIDYDLEHSASVHTRIVEVAERKKSAMIIMGKGSRVENGVEQKIIGANTSRVIRYSKVPVISVGNPKHCLEVKNILLPLDLSKETRQKVSWGIQMAKIFNADIKVVSALWDRKNPEVVNPLMSQMKQVEKFITKQGIKVESKIVESTEDAKSLVPILMNYIENQGNIDLALIMTQQEDDITNFFLGSLATEFIRKSNIPVMSIIPRETGEIVLGL